MKKSITKASESKLLKQGLLDQLGYDVEVDVLNPDTSGTGETVRYRASNLDVYIFELCDKELHKITIRTVPDGRQVPSRPLAFVYEQHLKNILDTEVMSIIRKLSPGTKVFITADHGFGPVHRERLWFDASYFNEPFDCSYRNAYLRQSLNNMSAPGKIRMNTWEFTVADLRLPSTERVKDKKTKITWQKQYTTIIFPKVGYAFSRPDHHFNPDVYSHGGISIQELMIPMVVLKVKDKDGGLLSAGEIEGPAEIVEGQEIEFRLHLTQATGNMFSELKAEVQAVYTQEPNFGKLKRQVLYIPSQGGADAVYRFIPDANDATDDERREGLMNRTLSITVSYLQDRRMNRLSRTFDFSIRLNSEKIVRRVPAHLGNLLGLTPRSMR